MRAGQPSTPRRTLKLLEDIRMAASNIRDFTSGMNSSDYDENVLIRSAVERCFEIIGEALTRLGRLDPAAFSRVRDRKQIVSFRNVLAHDYDNVLTEIVWEIIEVGLPLLAEDVKTLMAEYEQRMQEEKDAE